MTVHVFNTLWVCPQMRPKIGVLATQKLSFFSVVWVLPFIHAAWCSHIYYLIHVDANTLEWDCINNYRQSSTPKRVSEATKDPGLPSSASAWRELVRTGTSMAPHWDAPCVTRPPVLVPKSSRRPAAAQCTQHLVQLKQFLSLRELHRKLGTSWCDAERGNGFT